MDNLKFVKYAYQVKIDGLGRSKWQGEVRVNKECDDIDVDQVIHCVAERRAIANRESGEWPSEGNVMVWYAELDEYGSVKNEKGWVPLDTKDCK